MYYCIKNVSNKRAATGIVATLGPDGIEVSNDPNTGVGHRHWALALDIGTGHWRWAWRGSSEARDLAKYQRTI